MFDHEKLDVYQLELKFLGWATEFLVEVAVERKAVSNSSALKGYQNLAQGFNPRYGVLTRCALKAVSNSSALKGYQNLAQGFNPGYDVLTRCALKGHQTRGGELNSWIQDPARIRSGASFRAHPLGPRYPGLKPWAKFSGPFGAKDKDENRGSGRS